LPEFNEDVWFATIDKVVVYNDGNLAFYFKDGTELENIISENKIPAGLGVLVCQPCGSFLCL